MEGDATFEGELREGRDIVYYAVREIRGRADEEDGVSVDEAGDAADVDLVGWCGAGDEVDFDFEVFCCFAEGCVGGFGEDPVGGGRLVDGGRGGGGKGGKYISGSVTPRSAEAFCLAARQAMRMLSVPPMVLTPAAPGGALNRLSTMATISASILRTPGKTSGWIGFATVNLPYASVCSFSRSSSPW